jgi:hypothetical protein
MNNIFSMPFNSSCNSHQSERNNESNVGQEEDSAFEFSSEG